MQRRLVHGREPATDIADAELVAYPVVDGFDEAGGEEAALHVEIAAQQEVDTTHTQGEQHLDKKVGGRRCIGALVVHGCSLLTLAPQRCVAPLPSQTLYFLRHMSHITQSMDEEATARLLAKLDTVKYPKVRGTPTPATRVRPRLSRVVTCDSRTHRAPCSSAKAPRATMACSP